MQTDYIFTPYALVSVISAGISIIVALVIFPLRKTPGGRPLIFLMISTAIWSAGTAMEHASSAIPAKVFWAQIEYIGVLSAPVLFLLVALDYRRSKTWLTRQRVLLLFIVPLVTYAVALTNRWHGWIWANITPSPVGENLVIYQHGWWFWVGVVGYSYLLMMAGTTLIIHSALGYGQPFRRQSLLMVIGALIPWMGNLLYLSGNNPLPGYDPTPFLISIAGVLLAVGILRYHLLDLVPVAMQNVVDNMEDVIFVLDLHQRLLYLNPAAQSILAAGRQGLIGQPAGQALPAIQPVLEQVNDPSQTRLELTLYTTGAPRCYSVRVSPLYDPPQALNGRVVLLSDITLEKQAQEALQRTAILEERERMAQELHDNLGQMLSYLTLSMQVVREMIEQNNYTAALGQIDALSLSAQSVSRDVREYILDIKTQAEDVRSFSQVLKVYLERFEAITGLRVQLSLPQESIDFLLPQTAFFNLLRIIQEALANARKHAHANLVQIIFELEKSTLGVVISDDGRGFDVEAARGGFGLDIMRKRALQAGADLMLRSSPEQGTQILLKFQHLRQESAYSELTGVKVLVVDDHPLFIDGITSLLVTYGLDVVGVAQDGECAVNLAEQLRPDLVLLDVYLPHLSGPQAVSLIKQRSPETQVVMLSMTAEDNDLVEAMRNGASGFLLKSQPTDEFFAALVAVRKGEMSFAAGLEKSLARRYLEPKVNPTQQAQQILQAAGLSEQQVEITERVAKGQVYKEIATDLHLSESSIKYHMERIQTLLRLDNRADVIAYAYKISLVPERRGR